MSAVRQGTCTQEVPLQLLSKTPKVTTPADTATEMEEFPQASALEELQVLREENSVLSRNKPHGRLANPER